MPRLTQLMLRPYMAPEPGDDGSTPTEAPAAVLAEVGLTAEEFATLPDAERAALLGDTLDDTTPIESEEEAARLRAEAEAKRATPEPTAAPTPAPTPKPTPAPTAAPKAEKDDDGDVDEAGNKLANAPTPAPTAAPTPEPTAAPTPAPTAAPGTWHAVENVLALPEIADPSPFKPTFTDEARKARDTAQASLDELEEKFDNGDITTEEFKAQRAPLREEIRKADVAEAADAARAADRKEAVETRFTTWLHAGFEAAKKGGLDYLDPANESKLQELDAALVRYAKAAPLLYPGWTGAQVDRWALNQAHREVGAKYGVKFGEETPTSTPAPTPKPTPAPTQAPGTRAAPDLSKLPPTLAKAPPAADSNVQVDEFAHIDAMTPIEAERAVARMPPDMQERYLAR